MYNVLTLNEISPVINGVFTKNYNVGKEVANPDGIILRSFNMADYDLNENTIAIARAGAGVNNIPHAEYAKKGVVVFNTPGANANAVKELVVSALLMGSRQIVDAIEWVKDNKEDENLSKLVEKAKNQFVGPEILGKKLGVIGLGAIGAQVANTALGLGMEVYGYDPFLSVNNALQISRHIVKVDDINEIITNCDYITFHIPLLDSNKGMIDEKLISKMKDGVVIINCARGELANNTDVIKATESGKVARYICDFPTKELVGAKNVICTPHLGACTPEAEDNCAVMAAKELIDYIENGNINNSVNYPSCSCPRESDYRITLCHLNKPNMIAQITSILASNEINIENLANKAKGDYAYTILDINKEASEHALKDLQAIDGVIRVRSLNLARK